MDITKHLPREEISYVDLVKGLHEIVTSSAMYDDEDEFHSCVSLAFNREFDSFLSDVTSHPKFTSMDNNLRRTLPKGTRSRHYIFSDPELGHGIMDVDFRNLPFLNLGWAANAKVLISLSGPFARSKGKKYYQEVLVPLMAHFGRGDITENFGDYLSRHWHTNQLLARLTRQLFAGLTRGSFCGYFVSHGDYGYARFVPSFVMGRPYLSVALTNSPP